MEFDKLVVSFLVDEVVGGFFISVPPGHIACLYDRGYGVLKKTWGPGLHLKIPFWQIAKLFNAQILEYTITEGFDISHNKEALGDKAINANAANGKLIQVEGSILFRLDKQRIPEIWENVGEDFVSKVVRPVSRSRIRSVLSELTVDQLSSYRPQVEKRIYQELNTIFQAKGLICEGFLLSEIKYLGDPHTAADDKVLYEKRDTEAQPKEEVKQKE